MTPIVVVGGVVGVAVVVDGGAQAFTGW